MPMTTFILSFFLIAIFAFVFALIGLGAATIVIPVMYWVTGDIMTATAIGLSVNIATTSISTTIFAKQKKLNLNKVIPLLVASLLIPPLGAYVAHIVDKQVMLIVFATFLIFSATMSLLDKKTNLSQHPLLQNKRTERIFFLLIGIFTTFLAGMLGIGGGSILLPLLLLIGYDVSEIGPNMPPIVLLSSISGLAARFALVKHMNVPLLLVAIAAGLVGGIIASLMHGNLKGNKIMKYITSGLLLIIAGKILWKLFT